MVIFKTSNSLTMVSILRMTFMVVACPPFFLVEAKTNDDIPPCKNKWIFFSILSFALVYSKDQRQMLRVQPLVDSWVVVWDTWCFFFTKRWWHRCAKQAYYCVVESLLSGAILQKRKYLPCLQNMASGMLTISSTNVAQHSCRLRILQIYWMRNSHAQNLFLQISTIYYKGQSCFSFFGNFSVNSFGNII